jgi:hypothetical protein
MSTPGTSGSSSGSALPSSSSSTASLLAFINGLSGQSRHILLGQHTNYWDKNPMDIVTPIPAATGSQVAMLGTSNYFLGSDNVSDSLGVSPATYASISNTWLASGGIVVVTQNPAIPWTSGEAVTDTYTPGTNANNKWNTYLDAQVAWFKQLHGAVIWRPFGEPNFPGHFGTQFTPAQLVLLWKYTHDYFASKGVTNVLWMLNLNAWDVRNHGSTYYSGSDYYPGSAYVDIVSLDSYPPKPSWGWVNTVYNFLVTTGKPIIFAEVGSNPNDSAVVVNTFDNSTILNMVKANFPKVVGMLFWCFNQGIAKQNGASTLMSDPAIITLSDVPAAFLNGSSTSP